MPPSSFCAFGAPVAPLSLAYLAAALRAAGLRTIAIDGCCDVDRLTPLDDLPFVINGLTADDITARVATDSLFVGVSCMFSREWRRLGLLQQRNGTRPLAKN